jgi:hypothetical protein
VGAIGFDKILDINRDSFLMSLIGLILLREVEEL